MRSAVTRPINREVQRARPHGLHGTHIAPGRHTTNKQGGAACQAYNQIASVANNTATSHFAPFASHGVTIALTAKLRHPVAKMGQHLKKMGQTQNLKTHYK